VLEVALKQISKELKVNVFRASECEALKQEDLPLSTGVLGLDIALGIGGYRIGGITEILGAESAGKTTLCLHAVVQAQKRGMIAAYIDAEHSLEMKWVDILGVDRQRMLVTQPDDGETALEVANRLALSGEVGLIIVDSVAGLVPRAEIEGEIGDSYVALQARMMSQAMRKMAGTIWKNKVVSIFVNQIRMDISGWGNPETSPGGRALRYYSSARIDMRQMAAKTKMVEDDITIGHGVRMKVIKNKVAPPFRQYEAKFMYGKGFDPRDCALELGLKYNIIEKSGTWFSYNGNNLGQGKKAAMDSMTDSILVEIENHIRTAALPEWYKELANAQ